MDRSIDRSKSFVQSQCGWIREVVFLSFFGCWSVASLLAQLLALPVQLMLTIACCIVGVDVDTPSLAVAPDSESFEGDYDYCRVMQSLRLRLLDQLISYIPHLTNIGGLRTIPFFQVHIITAYNGIYLCCNSKYLTCTIILHNFGSALGNFKMKTVSGSSYF